MVFYLWDMGRNVFVFVVVLLTFIIGCKRDQATKPSFDLDGNWEIYEAFRNNEITTTLEDGYFKFMDSILETNILGSPISGPYKIDENSFYHDSALPTEYTISAYTDDRMELETEIRGFKFKFKLSKFNDSIPEN